MPPLAWVSEAGDAPAVWVSVAGDPRPWSLLGARPGFPADPDPLGTHLLAVTSENGPWGHREVLVLGPIDGAGSLVELATAQILRNPRWTPDGSAVVFESDGASFRDLYRVPRSGGPITRLTETEHGCFEPTLSADGAWLAWGASTNGNAEIWVARGDGGAPRQLTAHPAEDLAPAFLPDGRVSWLTTRDGRARVWVSDLSGDHAHPLRVDEGGADIAVAWSPTGVAAVTTSPRPGEVDLALVTGDGTVLHTFDDPGPAEHPAFSPDGSKVAFTRVVDGVVAVWVASTDGSGAYRVSTGSGPDWLPRWLRAPK